jgi:hypothetical protein
MMTLAASERIAMRRGEHKTRHGRAMPVAMLA